MRADNIEKSIAEAKETKIVEATPVTANPMAGGWFADQRSDKEKGLHHHDMSESGASKNFDQKIYFFPESYNQLRRELHDYYPSLWQVVGWPMAYAANIFVERMNEALDLRVTLDSDRVDAVCTEYLAALRKKRGISSH